MSQVEEVFKLKKSLAQAIDSSQNDNACDILSRLMKVKGNKDLLKQTEIGIFVNKLRSNKDTKIVNLAKEVVKKWRTDVEAGSSTSKPGTPQSKRPSTPGTPKAVPNLKQTQPSSDSPAKLQKVNQDSSSQEKHSASASPASATPARTPQSDGVSLPGSGDKVRDRCTEMLYTSLATDNGVNGNKIAKVAQAIETLLFDEYQGTTQPYKAKVRTLYLNLKDKKNPALRMKVIDGEITPARLCTMTTAEMASEERKAEVESLAKENLFKAQGAAENCKGETDQFKCGKCKQRRTSYFQMQTRSADEPMTTFVTCLNCNNHWKFC